MLIRSNVRVFVGNPIKDTSSRLESFTQRFPGESELSNIQFIMSMSVLFLLSATLLNCGV